MTIFALQGVIAWVVSLSLLVAAGGDGALGWVDAVGVVAWLVGFAFKAGGDAQLSRFLADPANRGKVLDRGFWRYARHPNDFGDTVVWWSYVLIALPAGGWWTAIGPLLMTPSGGSPWLSSRSSTRSVWSPGPDRPPVRVRGHQRCGRADPHGADPRRCPSIGSHPTEVP